MTTLTESCNKAVLILKALQQNGFSTAKVCGSTPAWKVFPGADDPSFLMLVFLEELSRWVVVSGSTEHRLPEAMKILQQTLSSF